MKQKVKTPDFENFGSFKLSEPSMEIDYLESCFYEDLENKKIKWMVFGHKAFPTSDVDMCQSEMGQMYYDAKETNGNSYIREYSRKFHAVRYSRNQYLNTMPEPPKPMKPSAYIKQLVSDLKKQRENAFFKLKMLGTDKTTIKGVKVAYTLAIEELEGVYSKPKTQSLRDLAGPTVLA